MAQYQITSWRDLPSMVVTRDGDSSDSVTKVQLAARFQEAIDEAAMRLGEMGSDDYLAGWVRSDWTTADGDHAAVSAAVCERLETEWTSTRIGDYLDSLGPAAKA